MNKIIVLKNISNVLLIVSDDKGLLIDSGYNLEDTKKIISYINKLNIKLEIIIISHYHKDHIQGIQLLNKTYKKVNIYATATTKYFYENSWLEDALYTHYVFNPSEKLPKININLIDDKVDFYNFHINVFFLNGHCYGNTAFKINNCLFCPDVIISNKDYLPFISDVSSYFYDIDKLLNIKGIKKAVLTHDSVIYTYEQFITELNNSYEIIKVYLNKIDLLFGKEISYELLLNKAIKKNIRTSCFKKEMNEEQYNYTKFVINNILKYFVEIGKIKIIYKKRKIFLKRGKNDKRIN